MSTISPPKRRRVSSTGKSIYTKTNNNNAARKSRSSPFTIFSYNPKSEQLIVLELEQSLETLKKQGTLQDSKLTAELRDLLLDEVLPNGDFTVYEGGDLNAFFQETEPPKRISEVCLVNDHFMLVKMPEACWRRNSQTDCIVEDVEASGEGTWRTSYRKSECPPKPNKLRSGDSNKCFRRKQTKISPIREEVEDVTTVNGLKTAKTALSTKNSWVLDGTEEVFKTRTKITGQLPIDTTKEIFMTTAKITGPLPIPKPLKQSNPPPVPQRKVKPRRPVKKNEEQKKLEKLHLGNRNSAVSKEAANEDTIDVLRSPIQPSVSDSIVLSIKRLTSSLQKVVRLEQHGIVCTQSEVLPTSGDTLANVPRVSLKKTPTKQKFLRLGPRFSAIRSFFNTSHQGSPKAITKPKPTPKINAIVYKTYFVRWEKPPDTLWHGYGLRRNTEAGYMPKLRRCRSAIF